MTHDFEYVSYDDADRIAILENKAAGLGDDFGDFTDRGYAAEPPADGTGAGPARPAAPDGPDGRTEALINRGRQRAKRQSAPRNLAHWTLARRTLAHWRLLAVGVVALLTGSIAALIALGGGSAAWPASVTRVQAQITQ